MAEIVGNFLLDSERASGGNASVTGVDTSNFNQNLSSADNTVQKALDTLDNLFVEGSSISTLTGSVSFVASSLQPINVVLPNSIVQVLRARAYISVNPGTDVDDSLLWNFYTKSTKRGEELLHSFNLPVIYRSTAGATTGNKVNVTGSNTFAVQDLVRFLGTPVEQHRIISKAVGNPQEIEVKDTLTSYPTGTGISLISELSTSVFTEEVDKTLYMEIEAPNGPVTMDLALELKVG